MVSKTPSAEYQQSRLEKSLDFGDSDEEIQESPDRERLSDYRDFLLERIEGRTGFMETLEFLSSRDLEKLYKEIIERSPRDDFRYTTRFR